MLLSVFPCFRVSQKRKIKRSPIDLKLHGTYFWKESNPGDLESTSGDKGGAHEGGGRALPPGRAPQPRGAPVAPPTYSFLLYIPTYPQTIRTGAKNLIPPPQPSVSTRSHLGACSGAPPEGASIMEGFYINTIAPPMKCE